MRNQLKSAIALLFVAHAVGAEVIVRAENPDPARLPTLTVEERQEWGQTFHYLAATFPNIPEFTCDLWCFESGGIDLATAESVAEGSIRMVHSWENHAWDIVTVATPEEESVEIVSTLAPQSEISDIQPDEYPGLNVCWQLRSAPGFASKPDPYPEFVKRCFIFTGKGRTFLDETERCKIPVRAPDHEYNNPPWVQMYLPVGNPDVRAGTSSWADYSPDHYTYQVIGAISRDGRFLTAIANDTGSTVCQAWHDCMHNNSKWDSARTGSGKEWRIRVYAMKNDPEALIDRMKKDFPNTVDR